MIDIINDIKWDICLAFFTSFLINILLVKTKRYHQAHTSDSFRGVQKIHNNITPRIGGLGILVGLTVVYLIRNDNILGQLLISGVLSFLVGMAEDITKKISVTIRLAGTILSGFLVCIIMGVSLTHFDILIVDEALKIAGVSIFFTAISIGGISNSVNMIDGLNGLASIFSMISITAISFIAYTVGDINLVNTAVIIGAAIFGFFLNNWPCGKIFLGDGGAYFCGFLIACMCILLVERNHAISPFACLLVCIYPFIEVIFSIYRRAVVSYGNPTSPDSLHLHSLIYIWYIRLNRKSLNANSVVGMTIGLLSVPPAIFAYYSRESSLMSIVGCAFFIILYALTYNYALKSKNK